MRLLAFLTHCFMGSLGMTVLVIVISAPFESPTFAGQNYKHPAKRSTDLINAIVNHNKPPKLVDRRKGHPRSLALFPKGYDWKEEARVHKALDNLYKQASVQLCEELVRRAHDQRYCITLVDNKTGDANNYSVGYICSYLAYLWLADAYLQHLPPDPAKGGERLTVSANIGQGKSLQEWRKKNAAKSLTQLQIELCEKAITQLAYAENVPKRDKDLAADRIRAEIAKLKKTKKPFAPKLSGFAISYRMIAYNRERADRVRGIVKSGSSENLEMDPLDE